MIVALRLSLFWWSARPTLAHVRMAPLNNRVGVILAGVERLMARFLAGKPVRRGPRVSVAVAVVAAGVAGGEAEAAVERPVRAESVWPRKVGWLLDEMQHHAALYSQQLATLLGEPVMVELLTACPQAGRLLRPVCRMLAVDPALLRPGVVVVARPVREPAKRVRKKRPPIDWGRIPLPRGVLSAARRAGFKPVR